MAEAKRNLAAVPRDVHVAVVAQVDIAIRRVLVCVRRRVLGGSRWSGQSFDLEAEWLGDGGLHQQLSCAGVVPRPELVVQRGRRPALRRLVRRTGRRLAVRPRRRAQDVPDAERRPAAVRRAVVAAPRARLVLVVVFVVEGRDASVLRRAIVDVAGPRQFAVDVDPRRLAAAVAAARRQTTHVRQRLLLTADVRRPTLLQPPQPLLLLPTFLRQSLFLSTLQFFRRDGVAAARLRVRVVCRAARPFLRVFALPPLRSSILKPDLQ